MVTFKTFDIAVFMFHYFLSFAKDRREVCFDIFSFSCICKSNFSIANYLHKILHCNHCAKACILHTTPITENWINSKSESKNKMNQLKKWIQFIFESIIKNLNHWFTIFQNSWFWIVIWLLNRESPQPCIHKVIDFWLKIDSGGKF